MKATEKEEQARAEEVKQVVITEADCSQCEFSCACFAPLAFTSFPGLKNLTWDEAGCPRQHMVNHAKEDDVKPLAVWLSMKDQDEETSTSTTPTPNTP